MQHGLLRGHQSEVFTHWPLQKNLLTAGLEEHLHFVCEDNEARGGLKKRSPMVICGLWQRW